MDRRGFFGSLAGVVLAPFLPGVPRASRVRVGGTVIIPPVKVMVPGDVLRTFQFKTIIEDQAARAVLVAHGFHPARICELVPDRTASIPPSTERTI